MSIITAILGKLGGNILQNVGDLAKIFVGSKQERDAAIASETKAIQDAYIAELTAPEKIGYFSSFIDNLNRLVRPMFTFGTVALMGWAVYNPVTFTITMTAMAVIPEQLWWIFLTIIGFWFGTRMLEQVPKTFKIATAQQLKAVIAAQKDLASINNDDVSGPLEPVKIEESESITPVKPPPPKRKTIKHNS